MGLRCFWEPVSPHLLALVERSLEVLLMLALLSLFFPGVSFSCSWRVEEEEEEDELELARESSSDIPIYEKHTHTHTHTTDVKHVTYRRTHVTP